jgi:hypothetical protein
MREHFKRMTGFATRIAELIVAASAIVLAAYSGEEDPATIFDFRQPVRTPRPVRAPGKHVFEVIDNGNTPVQNLIEVSDANRSNRIAIIQTPPTGRLDLSGKAIPTLDFRKNGRQPVLVAWSYPGTLAGHEFIYSRRKEGKIPGAHEVTSAVGPRGATPTRSSEGNG